MRIQVNRKFSVRFRDQHKSITVGTVRLHIFLCLANSFRLPELYITGLKELSNVNKMKSITWQKWHGVFKYQQNGFHSIHEKVK